MKYILLMNTMKAGMQPFPGWSQEEFEAHCTYFADLQKELRQSGELVSTVVLTFPDEAMVVRAGKDGIPITDGIFPESKEFLAGYSIIDVATPERAYEIAARVSAAPGPGSTPLNMPIEVRPVAVAPPPLESNS